MIDPISATMIAQAGGRLIDRVLGPQAPATPTPSATGFADAAQEALLARFKKLFAQNPELKEKLGPGPYTLASNPEGVITLTSTQTGKSIALDPASRLGQQAQGLWQAFQTFTPPSMVKTLEKGLELPLV